MSWLSGQGPEPDVVVSTRIRLARNLRGFPFATKMNDERAAELCECVQNQLKATAETSRLQFIPLRRSTDVCRDVLLERFLISRELAEGRADRAVAFDDAEHVSIMVNEEDHLRLQILNAGFDLDRAFSDMLQIDRALEASLEYAFSQEYGYLTSCPTNVGTGLRVSVMLHLPTLVTAQRELKKVFNVASRLNLAIRGLHGEGTHASGAFFQISNQITLGRTEREVVEDLGSVIVEVMEYERRIRRELFAGMGDELDRKVAQAMDLLRSGRPVGLEPSLSALSAILLALSGGRSPGPARADVLRLLVMIFPGHLQAAAGHRLQPAEIDRERGQLLRRSFNLTKNEGPHA